MKPRTSHEIEIKLRVENLHGLLRKLVRLKARRLRCVFEHNILFDTREKLLKKTGRLFRLRLEAPCGGPGAMRRGKKRIITSRGQGFRGLLTYKAPTRPSSKRESRYKVLEETEVVQSDPLRLPPIFAGLGLRPWFRYEKLRTTYRLRGLPALHVDVDETPIGVFLELEGPRRAIDRAARLLGYGPEDYLATNYWVLYRDDCRKQGRRPSDMLFRASHREIIAKSSSLSLTKFSSALN